MMSCAAHNHDVSLGAQVSFPVVRFVTARPSTADMIAAVQGRVNAMAHDDGFWDKANSHLAVAVISAPGPLPSG